MQYRLNNAKRVVKANAVATAATRGLRLVWTNHFQPCIGQAQDGKRTIMLPSLAAIQETFGRGSSSGLVVSDEDAGRILYGLMCHEIDHDLFTDMDILKSYVDKWAKADGKEKARTWASLANVFEDVHIEKNEPLKGRKKHLAFLAEMAEKYGLWDGNDSNSVGLLQMALLVKLRKEVVGQQLSTADVLEGRAIEAFGETLWNDIYRIARRGLMGNSTASNLDAVDKIRSLLKKVAKEQQQQQQQQQQQDQDQSGDQGSDQSQGNDVSDSQDASQNMGGDQGDDQDGGSNQDQNSGSGQDQDGSQSDGQGESPEQSSDNRSNKGQGDQSGDTGAVSNAEQQQGTTTKGGCQVDVQEMLSEQPKWDGEMSHVVENSEQPLVYSEMNEIDGGHGTMEDLIDPRAGDEGASVAQRIESLMLTQSTLQNRRSMSGTRLNKRMVATMGFNPYVFKKQQTEEALDTSVSVVMDTSSSMNAFMVDDSFTCSRLSLACSVTTAIVDACSVFNVPTSVTAFNTSFSRVKSFDNQSVEWKSSRFDIYGGTNTNLVVDPVAEELALQTTKRKMLLLIIDGDLNDDDAFHESVSFWRQRDIETRVILIADPNEYSERQLEAKFRDVPYASVATPSHFSDAIIEAMASTVLSEE